MDDAITTGLGLYEMPKPWVEGFLRFVRMGNTAFDTLFYDVTVFTSELAERGITILSGEASDAPSAGRAHLLDLTALTNPSGSVIVVDAAGPNYVRPVFLDMGLFFEFAATADGAGLKTLAVTGVGSSALGSAAFAWDVSKALREPVAAIVPGYGLADLLPQALGGWLGFEVYDALQSVTQAFLANAMPPLASVGKHLALSTPGRGRAVTGAPVFRYGSAASDDVHAILEHVPAITRLVGHSKGALAIENAFRSLPPERTEGMRVTTLGCVIAEERDCKYHQVLGLIDGIGFLNSGGHWPEIYPDAHHSTNSLIPFSLSVSSAVCDTPP